ncbi:hypothetical protein WJX77_001592 [Trebouxia sp. C0004]
MLSGALHDIAVKFIDMEKLDGDKSGISVLTHTDEAETPTKEAAGQCVGGSGAYGCTLEPDPKLSEVKGCSVLVSNVKLANDHKESALLRPSRSTPQALGTEHCKSTSYHPQSNGQTERMTRVLEDMLRHFVNPRYLLDVDQAMQNARKCMEAAQQRQKRYADERRADLLFEVDDKC